MQAKASGDAGWSLVSGDCHAYPSPPELGHGIHNHVSCVPSLTELTPLLGAVTSWSRKKCPACCGLQ